jgi:tetratricopeptide (TPR) repeat protein
MINSIDLNSIDVIENISPTLIPDNYTDYSELVETENTIKQQYVNLENLGINLINNINPLFISTIYAELLNYTNNNYLSIVDYDASIILPEKLLEVGENVYNFICVDCYNMIIPQFLIATGCTSLESFDLLIKNKYKNDYSIVKANLVKTINNIIDELLKLQRLDKTIQTDEKYQKLLRKCTYYIELVDFGNTEKFINNYVRPLLVKNLSSILWRIM